MKGHERIFGWTIPFWFALMQCACVLHHVAEWKSRLGTVMCYVWILMAQHKLLWISGACSSLFIPTQRVSHLLRLAVFKSFAMTTTSPAHFKLGDRVTPVPLRLHWHHLSCVNSCTHMSFTIEVRLVQRTSFRAYLNLFVILQ